MDDSSEDINKDDNIISYDSELPGKYFLLDLLNWRG